MKTKYISLIVIFFIIVIFIIFSNRNNDTGRWYSEKQVKLGEQVFLKNCASCHGEKAEKTKPNSLVPSAIGFKLVS